MEKYCNPQATEGESIFNNIWPLTIMSHEKKNKQFYYLFNLYLNQLLFCLQAEENNVLFMPIAGKTQEAKQVYKCGKYQVYVDRNVLFMFENEQWIPISIQKMIDKAKDS